MSLHYKRVLLTGLSALAVALSGTAHATNGYFSHGYGTKNKGMAGAGVALPQDALAAATNPAGMVWVGERMDFGLSLFSPRREYRDGSPSGPAVSGATAGQDSDSEFFPIPSFGRNWQLSSDESFGISIYGNGGMNTDYAQGVYAGGVGGRTGVDLAQLFIVPTYSQKLNAKSSWGVAPILAFQRFQAEGLSPFAGFSSNPNALSNNGHDTSWGGGLRIGYQAALSPDVDFGISATSRIYMSEFDDYAGLFAEQGDFDIPPQVTLGIAWKTGHGSVFTADLQHIWYSDIDAIANPASNLANCMPGPSGGTGSGCLGAGSGGGFGWDDMTILKLGYQWRTSPDWTWRAGISYGEQPIPNSEVLFNILAPAVVETHITGGFTHTIDKESELSLSFMYAPANDVTGTVGVFPPPTPPDTITIEMNQFELELAYSVKF